MLGRLLEANTPTRYNAPEVADQKDKPIPIEQLHKCDIWAFGLCAWEILANGQLYFQRSWRRNPLYERSSSLSTLTSPTGSHEESIDEDDQHVFGHFDLSHLKILAIEFVNNMKIPGIGFERGFLRPLMDRTLQTDPAKRISDLSRLPIIVSWHKMPGGHSLQSKLATYAMSGDVRYSIFSRESGPHIIWEQQQQLLQDFETVAQGAKSDKDDGAIAFQTMLCYTNAFGASQDLDKAVGFLRMAENTGHLVARVLGPRIINGFSLDPSTELTTYSECLALGFSITRRPEVIRSLVVHDGTSVSRFTNYADFREAFVKKIPQSWINDSDGALGVFLTVNESTVQHSLLDIALQQGDAQFVEKLLPLTRHSDAEPKLDPHLVMAASRGYGKLLISLLTVGVGVLGISPPPSLLHWLFCLDEATLNEAQPLMKDYCRKPGLKQALNYVLTEGDLLHPQWPFQVHGTPLAMAIVSGRESLVKLLLSLGADPLAPAFAVTDDSRGPVLTPIHLAIKYHQPDILLLLWKAAFGETKPANGTCVHKVESLGPFPIACCLSLLTNAERFAIHGCMYKHRLRELVKLLPLEILLQTSPEGKNSITQAIDLEDVDTVELLLEHAPTLASRKLVQPGNKTMFTYPFHFAVQIASYRDTRESAQIAESILNLDSAAINRPDSAPIKPLHIASMGTSDRMTKFLLARNASCHDLDASRRTPLHFCRALVNAKALMLGDVNINHKDRTGSSPAHAAASQGADEVLKMFIAAGADLTLVNNDIGTPLHCAIQRKSRSTIEILLAAGVDIKARNRRGQTPLHLTMDMGRSDLVSLLFEHGADPFTEDGQGSSPFSMSLAWENPSIFNLFRLPENFVVEKVHVNALIFAAAKGEPKVFRQYLDRLPDPSRNLARVPFPKLYVTAINVAAGACRVDLVEMLLAHGFNVDTRDERKNTPLLQACQAGRTEVEFYAYNRTHTCEKLIQHGANMFARSDQGLTPFLIAQAHGDFPLMTLLLERALALRDIDVSTRRSRILESIRDPEKDRTFCRLSKSIMGDKIIEPRLLSDAVKNDEWEFVMICIAGHFVDKKDLEGIFQKREWMKPSVDTLDMLRYHSVKMDREMVQYLASGAEESSPDFRYSARNVGRRNVEVELIESRGGLNELIWPETMEKLRLESMIKSGNDYNHCRNALADLERKENAFCGKLQEYFASIITTSKEPLNHPEDMAWFRKFERDLVLGDQDTFDHRLKTLLSRAKFMHEKSIKEFDFGLTPEKTALWMELHDQAQRLQEWKEMIDATLQQARMITQCFYTLTGNDYRNDGVVKDRSDRAHLDLNESGRVASRLDPKSYVQRAAIKLMQMNSQLLLFEANKTVSVYSENSE
jgi:ankyrin repeat protein